MTRTIKLMAEYGHTIVWGVDGCDIGPVDYACLPLSADLKAALRAWAAAYDKTLNQDYPPDSGFADATEEEAFEIEGQRLWHALQDQLGSTYTVFYQDCHGRKHSL